jgi:hypothetical protein
MMAVILLTDNDVYTVAEQAQTGLVLLVVLLLTYVLHRPSGRRHSCACYEGHSLLTRSGNRADHVGSGKLGTRSSLEFSLNVVFFEIRRFSFLQFVS